MAKEFSHFCRNFNLLSVLTECTSNTAAWHIADDTAPQVYDFFSADVVANVRITRQKLYRRKKERDNEIANNNGNNIEIAR